MPNGEAIEDTILESRKKEEKIHLQDMSKGKRKQKIEDLIWRFLIYLESSRQALQTDEFWITGSDITRKYNLHPGYGSLVTAVLKKQRKHENQKIPFKVLQVGQVKVKNHTKPICRFLVKRVGRI